MFFKNMQLNGPLTQIVIELDDAAFRLLLQNNKGSASIDETLIGIISMMIENVDNSSIAVASEIPPNIVAHNQIVAN